MELKNPLVQLRSKPGFQSSQGKQIYESLSKLWEKITKLQNSRNQKTSKDDPKSGDALCDLQYKTLRLQITIIDKLLQKQQNSRSDKRDELNIPTELPDGPNDLCKDKRKVENSDFIPTRLQKATQTSSLDDIAAKLPRDESISTNIKSIYNQEALSREVAKQLNEYLRDTQRFDVNDNVRPPSTRPARSRTLSSCSVRNSMRGHYHMKLSDVPFIVAKSTSASHSVIANVQSIVGKMKRHNSVLCSTNSQATESTRSTKTMRIDDKAFHQIKVELRACVGQISILNDELQNVKKKLKAGQCDAKSDVAIHCKNVSEDMESITRSILDLHQRLKEEQPTIKMASTGTESSRGIRPKCSMKGSTNRRLIRSLKETQVRFT